METTTILGLVILWIIIGAIVGSFGKSRTIGFTGSFFASVLLSPVLAMLFILASDKSTGGKLTGGEKSLFIIPIIICILIPLGISGAENVNRHTYQVYNGEQAIEFLTNLTQDDFSRSPYATLGREYINKYNDYNNYSDRPYQLVGEKSNLTSDIYYNFTIRDYFELEWKSTDEINEWRKTEINHLRQQVAQHTNLGLRAFFN